MSLKKVVLFVLVLAITSGGCKSTLEQLRGRNRENILKLAEGMSSSEVKQIMGTKTRGGKYGEPMVSNPYKSEIIIAGGNRYEVLYYYTEIDSSIHISNPSVVRDGDLTPLVFKDNKLIGWGRGFLTALTNDD